MWGREIRVGFAVWRKALPMPGLTQWAEEGDTSGGAAAVGNEEG